MMRSAATLRGQRELAGPRAHSGSRMPPPGGPPREALASAERNGLLEVAGHARAVLASVALLNGRPREASALLSLARQVACQTNSKPLQVRVYLWSGFAAFQQKRWGDALNSARLA